jgi:hypothetical protein
MKNPSNRKNKQMINKFNESVKKKFEDKDKENLHIFIKDLTNSREQFSL